jgi:hypothetical protein
MPPKIHNNSMLPSTCSIDPCRNIENTTASQTFFCGKARCGASIPAAGMAHAFAGVIVPSGTSTIGLPVRTSQGTPDQRYSNRASAFASPCFGYWMPK